MVGEVLFVLAGLSVMGWQQRRRRGRTVMGELQLARARGHWDRAEELLKLLLPHVPHNGQQAQLRMYLAEALDRQDRFAEAAEVLDPALARNLEPREMAAWHNTRGLALALCDRFAEADDEFELAEVVVGDDEHLEGRITYAAVVGNRGITELRRGRLDRAEELIRQAHRMFHEVLRDLPSGSPHSHLRTEWEAEHHYWMAEIAGRSGNAEQEQTRLAEAARLEGTQYGARARRRLAA